MTNLFTKEQLLAHWQGHRALTRKTLVAFPEEELYRFHITSMRSFGCMINELLSIAVPALESIATQTPTPFQERKEQVSKAQLLELWDQDTEKIDQLFSTLAADIFQVKFNLFLEYDFPVIDSLLYIIDNEVHHRAQGFTYLRALNLQPPFFWER